MQRYFLNEMPTGNEFRLPEEVVHHFITVLRSCASRVCITKSTRGDCC